MQLIRVSAAALNQTPLDFEGNTRRILQAIEEAKAQHVGVLCLPELCITGYGCEDVFLMPWLYTQALEALHTLVPHTKNITVAVGLPVVHEGVRYNTACVVSDGRIVAFIPKQHLANEGVHYEHRWFTPWQALRVGHVCIENTVYPFGDVLCDIGGVKIGFEICEDAWVNQRPGLSLAQRGADLILSPSASHFACGKHVLRQRLVEEGSRAYAVGYVYANLMGNEAGRVVYDGGCMVASLGTVLHQGVRFSYKDVELTTCVLNLSDIRREHALLFPHTDSSNTVSAPFEYPALQNSTVEPFTQALWETSFYLKEEEFTRAVCLGLFDYMRKSQSRGFVVSLSGGCDSTMVAVLCRMCISLGVLSCGWEGFLKKLSHMKEVLKNICTQEDLATQWLTCVYQSTRNSSSVTRDAAHTVSRHLQAQYVELNLESLVEAYTHQVSEALNTVLSWDTHDIALQNIQARTRGPSVWMVANLKRALLLATSNRSEAAVGYATMDGDTCGGLSPLAGIDKPFLRHCLQWLEHTGPQGIGPMPFLSCVTSQAPTAELRPSVYAQTDETDLMPYEILNAIEHAFVGLHMQPSDIPHHVHTLFPYCSAQEACQHTQRFFSLWHQNQWKRERYAPAFHLDSYSLDPKTHFRFPVLNHHLCSSKTTP
jgi:NAD+ synthase (glutamine-hydrolysing)